MDQERIELVQSSLAKLLPKAQETAEAFYDRLFEINPEARDLFSGDMRKQSEKFMSTLGHVVQGLDRLEVITPSIERMGREHADYGVKAEHYNDFRDAFLWAIERELGDEFTDELRSAWEEAYQMIAVIMLASGGRHSQGYKLDGTPEE